MHKKVLEIKVVQDDNYFTRHYMTSFSFSADIQNTFFQSSLSLKILLVYPLTLYFIVKDQRK